MAVCGRKTFGKILGVELSARAEWTFALSDPGGRDVLLAQVSEKTNAESAPAAMWGGTETGKK